MLTLVLTLKKKWFDMILSGEKTEEYREIKKYWDSRLNKPFDSVCFKNGYSKTSSHFTIELKQITRGVGNPYWGAPDNEVYILKLGDIIIQ